MVHGSDIGTYYIIYHIFFFYLSDIFTRISEKYFLYNIINTINKNRHRW